MCVGGIALSNFIYVPLELFDKVFPIPVRTFQDNFIPYVWDRCLGFLN